MRTKDYITKFNLNQKDWNRKAFFKELEKEFAEKIEVTKSARERMGCFFEFNHFAHLVKEMQDKFWSISAHKTGEPFSKALFSAFYASVIIKYRAQYFPKEDAEIKAKREARMLKEAESQKS